MKLCVYFSLQLLRQQVVFLKVRQIYARVFAVFDIYLHLFFGSIGYLHLLIVHMSNSCFVIQLSAYIF